MAGILKLTNLLSQFKDGAPTNGFAEVGEKIEYVFDIENTGDAALTGITLANPDFTITTTGFDGTLAVGQKKTVTAIYVIKATDLDNGRVSIAPKDLSGNPTDSSSLDVENLNVRASLSVSKTIREIKDVNNNGISDFGDQVIYDIAVTNSSPRTVFNATLKDSPGTTNANIPVELNGLTDSDNDGQQDDLAIGQTATGEFTYTLTQADVDRGTTSNRADAEGRTKTNSVIRGSGTATVDIGSNGQLEVIKTAGNVKDAADIGEFIDKNNNGILGDAGDQIQYSYTVKNIGNVTLTDVVLLDDKGTPRDSDNENIILSKTTLAPGESTTGTYVAPWTQANIDAGSLTNTVTATAKTPNGDPVEPKTDEETVGITAKPAFEVVKTAGNVKDAADVGEFVDLNGNGIFGDAGDQVKYSYTVTNTGNVTLSDVVLLDDKGTPLDTDNQNIILSKTTLAPGESATGSYLAPWTQANIDAGSVTNIVTATAKDPKGNPLTPKQDQETVGIAPNPAIDVTKTANPIVIADAKVGDPVTYNYTLKNTGNVSLLNVQLVDDNGTPLDPSDDITIKAAGLTGLADLDGDLAIDDLAIGTTATASYTGRLTQIAIDAKVLTNIVTGTGTSPNGVIVNDKDTATVTITPPILKPPAIKLIKTAGAIQNNDCDPNPSVGDTVTYTYEVSNIGQVNLFNLKLMDDNGTPNIAGDDFEIQIAGLETLDNIGTLNDLAVGKTTFGYYTKTLTAEDLCDCFFTNIGTVEGFSSTGQKVTAIDDATIVFCPPSIELEKCAELDLGCDQVLNVGDLIKYTFNITNNGRTELNQIVLDDPFLTQNSVEIKFAREFTTLNVGESVSAYATYRLTANDIEAGFVHNVATVRANPSFDQNNDPTNDVSATAEASVSLPKWRNPFDCKPKPVDPCESPKKSHWGRSRRDQEYHGSTRHDRWEKPSDCFGDRPTWGKSWGTGKPEKSVLS